MEDLIQHRTISTDSLFDSHYLSSRSLFMYCFNKVPCISFVDDINAEKAFDGVKEKYHLLIRSLHQYRTHSRKQKKVDFDDSVLVLSNECVLEFDNGYCEIMHNHDSEHFVLDLVDFLKTFKEKQRRKPLEMNLVVRYGVSLELKSMEIKRTNLKLDLFYEDDFIAIDELIRKRLNQPNDKGIVLLHGLPGAGKTTYLRHLIGKVKKRVMFMPPNMANSLTDPGFIDLLIENPNSVVVIEDAENIIMDRRVNHNSSVSNLLNISDGLLADFLNVQLICTFNHSLTLIDSALMRKGRLIAKYEFGKLSVKKAQRLSDHFGFKTTIHQPMTIAQLANQHEVEQRPQQIKVTGFRREPLETAT